MHGKRSGRSATLLLGSTHPPPPFPPYHSVIVSTSSALTLGWCRTTPVPCARWTWSCTPFASGLNRWRDHPRAIPRLGRPRRPHQRSSRPRWTRQLQKLPRGRPILDTGAKARQHQHPRLRPRPLVLCSIATHRSGLRGREGQRQRATMSSTAMTTRSTEAMRTTSDAVGR
jgi:hypothetical protein